MALTKSIITGRVVLPTDAPAKAAEVTFTLSGFDTEGADVVLPATERAPLKQDGSLPDDFGLWPNIEGLRGTSYRATARWTEVCRSQGTIPRDAVLGDFVIGDQPSYALPDLLLIKPPPGLAATVVLTQAQYDALTPPDPANLYLVVQA
ncbi:phage upper tail fiber protein [Pseudogemmobacter faecipullorum]|uniref:Minor tail protein gp31 C-terminal domain-containing protein n=1 Tax=Pseudogemmobacter faecipullorum TaxID=2755041 RepID=A0ABS8CQU7_9RHOB|nr:hypothetical protein [Pseudogemmobacter faecipullorum]MCB5411771.1 hypothetical protein [Pseudogemmobacter faecipullorum]